MKKETILRYSYEEDDMLSTEVDLLSKDELINFMLDKDQSKFSLNLFTPHNFIYDENILEEEYLYYIIDNEIYLFLNE